MNTNIKNGYQVEWQPPKERFFQEAAYPFWRGFSTKKVK
jgi:hypothetical protein